MLLAFRQRKHIPVREQKKSECPLTFLIILTTKQGSWTLQFGVRQLVNQEVYTYSSVTAQKQSDMQELRKELPCEPSQKDFSSELFLKEKFKLKTHYRQTVV